MLIIGIAGGTGSGKTTVVKKIKERFKDNEVVVIPQDSYYKDSSHLPLEERQALNFDHPDAIDFDLLIEHLKELREERSVEQPTYSYITCSRGEETVKVDPAHIIIIEGILIFTNSQLRELLDISVFVDADSDDRLSRVISRDIIERGKSVANVLDRYEKTVKPMHMQFIEPTKRYADLILPQGGHNKVGIDILIATIEKAIQNR